MIIGIDGNEANLATRVGVNHYAFELLWALYRIQGEITDYPIEYVIYLKASPLADMPPARPGWTYRILPAHGTWILSKLMPRLMANPERLTVFFTPSHYLPPWSPMPLVCAIMDLGYLEFSGQFRKKDFWQLKYWSAISIKISKRIIAISEATRNDIVRHYPSAARKITVTHLAHDATRFNTSISDEVVRRTLKKYHIVKDYILFIGTLKPSKNLEGTLRAFAAIADRFDGDLVVAGKKGWLYAAIAPLVAQLGLTDRVIFTDYLPEADKPALMAGARVLVSPSFWEGFGLHALEAMACGTPVVVSNVASFPEVVGKAGILVDPNSIDSIAAGLEKVLTMSKLTYNKLSVASAKQAARFSWAKTARETVEVLKSAI